MEMKKELLKQKEEIERKLKELENQDFQEIKHKDKIFRIYKWEDKRIKDFVYQEGFRMAEFQEFIDLIDSKKIKLEDFEHYYVKHFSKLQQNKEWCLSRVYLDRCGDLVSYYGSLSDSNDVGRVVCVK